jgi:phage terminase large subunit-like protein
MVEGESGLMACFPPAQRPVYEPSKRLVRFASGSVAYLFSAEEPERLRGPQCHAFWADEIAAWQYAQETWDNLLFGFRLGDDPRGVITTTPKPIKVVRDILADPHTATTHGTSYDNRANLAPAFFDSIIQRYEGTRLGRQELLAELLEDVPGALWTRKNIEDNRILPDDGGCYNLQWDKIVRIVVGVDPAVTSNPDSDETGIVVAGLTMSRHVLILADRSLRATTDAWARAVIDAYSYFRCDRVIGEVNQGGDLIEAALRNIDPQVAFRGVRATKGKVIRAEPVAALYEQGRVHHAGPGLETLEDQLCTWSPQSGMDSPDRLDALVWAITELLIDNSPAVMPVQFGTPYQIS